MSRYDFESALGAPIRAGIDGEELREGYAQRFGDRLRVTDRVDRRVAP